MRCWTMRWLSWRLSRRACRPCRQRRWPMREPALRKVNLERLKAKLRDQYLEGKGVDASQATRHGCLTTPSSPWKCRRGQMISGRLWRGGSSAPWSWMTPKRGRHQGEVCPLHPEAQRGAEPVEPGGAAGGDARPGDTAPPLAPKDQSMPPQDLDSEEGKLSLLLWAMNEAPR